MTTGWIEFISLMFSQSTALHYTLDQTSPSPFWTNILKSILPFLWTPCLLQPVWSEGTNRRTGTRPRQVLCNCRIGKVALRRMNEWTVNKYPKLSILFLFHIPLAPFIDWTRLKCRQQKGPGEELCISYPPRVQSKMEKSREQIWRAHSTQNIPHSSSA